MANVAVGIEVNQRMMRLVELKKSRRGPTLSAMGKAKLPPGTIDELKIKDSAMFKQTVEQLFERSGAGKVNVCLSIASDQLDIRTLHLPRMPEKDLRQTIQWELERLVRFDDDIVFDYQTTGEGSDGGRDLLVVSAPRGLIYSYLLPFHSMGYFPEIIDVGGFSLPLSCPRGGAVGHVVLGPSLVHLQFMHEGIFKLSRTVPVPLSHVLDIPASGQEGVTALDAALMAEVGAGGPVSSAIQSLSRAIIQTVEGAYDLGEADTLIVSGEGALVDGMIRFIEEDSGIRTIAADPLIGPGEDDVLGRDAPAYAVAVGLAIRGLEEL